MNLKLRLSNCAELQRLCPTKLASLYARRSTCSIVLHSTNIKVLSHHARKRTSQAEGANGSLTLAVAYQKLVVVMQGLVSRFTQRTRRIRSSLWTRLEKPREGFNLIDILRGIIRCAVLLYSTVKQVVTGQPVLEQGSEKRSCYRKPSTWKCRNQKALLKIRSPCP